MTQRWLDDGKFPASDPPSCFNPTSSYSTVRRRNVFQLLVQREISPRTKRCRKNLWGEVSTYEPDNCWSRCEMTDAKYALSSWVESESLRHLSAKYCSLRPPPRSTIAAAFSPDGTTLASTHGDHTVKIIHCQTGNCLKVLSGHRRTPWVVRFHPLFSEILASGSLDHEVRLWDARTAVCIGSHTFYRPIASIAFHAQGELLAVASGHKLYIWNYNRRGEDSSPVMVLKTRRSLRAVHFHPHAAPFLLTAEVNDIDLADSPLTVATSTGYSHYPPPAIFLANVNGSLEQHLEAKVPLIHSPCIFWPAVGKDDGRTQPNSDGLNQDNHSATSMDISPEEPSGSNTVAEMHLRNVESTHLHQLLPFNDPSWWDPPFSQGWLMVQTNTGSDSRTVEPLTASSSMATAMGNYRARAHLVSSAVLGSREGALFFGAQNNEAEVHPSARGIGSELPSSLATAGTAELPCTVKLRIWPHDIRDPCALLDPERCLLTISHAVLCSEMGAHFSPCGRFLVACVACLLPHMEVDPGIQSSQMQHDSIGAATSPTRHPVSSHRVMYELRVYSLEEATFGNILASRAIRAAHCLTSIQFSPTSEHILLAYGRRHSSLLRSMVIDGETAIPIYTILEVYRVSDMELVRVLPSAEDEVNVACFHPLAGGGLVYGTKEGKLRILQYNRQHDTNCTGPNFFFEENLLEADN
ncbi:uncharacterized protein LOC109727192 isoform X2 [Ananas comosus]|uniref:Uncharacterized protein LOC109727192 isoform X2 n=2 Tax=Ananas comosus TaxID=4615 RepID=A0A6P5GVS5_ANACO|nr:uncharacterized protein LOC109727192 isoform X2 [Ananas comosus]